METLVIGQVSEVHFQIGKLVPSSSPTGKRSSVITLLENHQINFSYKHGYVFLEEKVVICPAQNELPLLSEALSEIECHVDSGKVDAFFLPRFTIDREPFEEECIIQTECLTNFSHIEQLDEPLQPDELEYHKIPFSTPCYKKGDYYYILESGDVLHRDSLIVTECYVKMWNEREYKECRDLKARFGGWDFF